MRGMQENSTGVQNKQSINGRYNAHDLTEFEQWIKVPQNKPVPQLPECIFLLFQLQRLELQFHGWQDLSG